MRLFRLWLAVLAVVCLGTVAATPAHADPVSAAIAAWTAFQTGAPWLIVAFEATKAVVGLSISAQGLARKKTAAATGVKTTTSGGGTTPQTFIVGKYATAGQAVCPPMSYGVDGKTPNAYLVYVIALGCIPGQQISRIVINDNYVTIGTTEETIGGSTVLGYPLQDDYAGYAWIRYHDGTQTEADALLMQKCADYPDRPWSADMILTGIPYIVAVFKLNTELYSGEPSIRPECIGIPLYDPRHDDTVGGAGDQRFDDPSTWVTTTNNMVVSYNIHRGIALPDGLSWGGEAAAEDLPLDNWFAAMNACDEAAEDADGAPEPMYQCGMEISLSDEPAAILEALNTACCAQSVEIGGVWKVRVGGPGLPVYFMDDGAILIDHDENRDLFPSLADTHNGIQATHPLPSNLWENTDAPPIYNDGTGGRPNWEAEDGGRRLVADLPITACWIPTQAQRIMTSVIADARRFRRHGHTRGPYASMLEPLDSIAWTSAAESYTAKVFELTRTQLGLRTLNNTMMLRERDGLDFVPPSVYLPWVAAIPGSHLPVAQEVPGFSVTGTTIKDGNGTDRRAAPAIEWDAEDLLDIDAVMYEVRVLPSLADVTSSSTDNVAAGGIVVAEGIVGSTDYQARAKLVTKRRSNWTSWVTATTPNVRLATEDLPEEVVTLITSTADDLLSFYLDLQTYKQITDSLLYTGDGRSIQYVSLQAINRANDAQYKVDLLGVLSADSSAFVLNTSFVKINADTTLAGFVTTVNSSIGDLESSVTETATAVDGLKAQYMVKVQAGKYIAGVYAGADDTTGTSEVGVFASKFFVGDTSDPDHPIQVMLYGGGVFSFNTDIRVHGAAIFDDSVTIQGIALNTFIVPAEAETVSFFHGDGSTIYTLCATTVTLDVAGTIEVSGALIQGFPSGDDNWNVWIYIDGSLSGLTSYVQGDWTQVAVPLFNTRAAAAGAHTVEIKWKGGASVENVAATLFVKGIQKVA
ncbi:MAG: DUF1983 domain-containing protein [Asticcacaulis sp.]|nr:DUF1983 domain-containing protein [Asticcacaulis sp.]